MLVGMGCPSEEELKKKKKAEETAPAESARKAAGPARTGRLSTRAASSVPAPVNAATAARVDEVRLTVMVEGEGTEEDSLLPRYEAVAK